MGYMPDYEDKHIQLSGFINFL